MLNLWNEQQQEYLGTGLSFPLELNAQGQMKLSTQALKVKESILIILNTRIGERYYRPTFGCGLSDLTFAPLNFDTMLQIRLKQLPFVQMRT
jgi:phage baseplate assembly protein W